MRAESITTTRLTEILSHDLILSFIIYISYMKLVNGNLVFFFFFGGWEPKASRGVPDSNILLLQ